jgi:hypothetical protein
MQSAVHELLTNGELWSVISRRRAEYVSTRHGNAPLDPYVDALLSLGTTADVR